MSFQDAALKVLQEEGKPLSAEEITQKALQKGLIETNGKTPSATMGANIYIRSIVRRGKNSVY